MAIGQAASARAFPRWNHAEWEICVYVNMHWNKWPGREEDEGSVESGGCRDLYRCTRILIVSILLTVLRLNEIIAALNVHWHCALLCCMYAREGYNEEISINVRSIVCCAYCVALYCGIDRDLWYCAIFLMVDLWSYEQPINYVDCRAVL